MSRQLTYVLIADGGTDRALMPIIEWAIREIDPTVDILEAEFVKRKGTVDEFVRTFSSGAMLIFVHRDAERESYAHRLKEFDDVSRDNLVPVIPVRMSETWLLIDGAAITLAAGSSSARVSLPVINSLESLANPKARLEELLIEAAGGLTGRALKKFKSGLVERRVDVARRVGDFSKLRGLPAFLEFESKLASAYPYKVP